MREIHLTPREREVLDAFLNSLGGGTTNKHIARYLGLVESTVKVHFKALLWKTASANRADLAIWWFRHQPVEDPGMGIRT